MTRMLAVAFAALLPLTLPAAAAQQPRQQPHPQHEQAKDKPTRAVCVMIPTEGNNVRGLVHLTAGDGHVRLRGKVTGLKPGLRAFHIHQYGDLSAPDGTAAGDHYNPHGHPHGGPDDEQRHLGDLGNIRANEQGIAEFDIQARGVALHEILGRSLVVHAEADDLKSQPAGDAGPRVAVGVIGIAGDKPETATRR